MRAQRLAVRLVIFVVFLALAVSFLYPFVFMAINSLKTRATYMADPFNLPKGNLAFDNYTSMITNFNLLELFRNTAIVTLLSISLVLIFATMASYAIAKLRFRWKGAIYLFIIATISIPPQATIIPLYVMFGRMGLVNTYWSVVLSYLAGGLPGSILLLTANFRGIPTDLFEAGKLDGSGYFRTLWSILVPLGRPAISLNFIFFFVGWWNDLFLPMILIPGSNVRTWMVALASVMQRQSADPTFQFTGLLMGTVPAILVYLVFQRNLIRGVMMGAVK